MGVGSRASGAMSANSNISAPNATSSLACVQGDPFRKPGCRRCSADSHASISGAIAASPMLVIVRDEFRARRANPQAMRAARRLPSARTAASPRRRERTSAPHCWRCAAMLVGDPAAALSRHRSTKTPPVVAPPSRSYADLICSRSCSAYRISSSVAMTTRSARPALIRIPLPSRKIHVELLVHLCPPRRLSPWSRR